MRRSRLSPASRRMATFIRTGPGRTHGGRQNDADRRPGGRGGAAQGQGREHPRGEGGRPAQRCGHRRGGEGQGRPHEPPGHPLILRELADRLGCALRGDGAVEVDRVAPIDAAGPGSLTFVASARWAVRLRTTQASAVILQPSVATPLPSLLSDNPYLAFARAVALLNPKAGL